MKEIKEYYRAVVDAKGKFVGFVLKGEHLKHGQHMYGKPIAVRENPGWI